MLYNFYIDTREKRMKKCLLLMILPMLLLSACAVAKVSYRLGGDFSVNIDYLLELKPGDNDVTQYTNAITQYWTDMGFSTTIDETDGVTTVKGNKQDAYDSPETAVQAFSALLDDEDSLFQDARLDYTPSFDYDRYSLMASVSLEDIIRQSDVQNIPEGEIESLEGDAADGTYTLCIALPGEVASTNADSVQDGVCTWNLAYGEVTQISLETSKLNQENKDYYAQLEEQQHRDEQLLLLCGGTAVVLLLALIIVTIVRNHRKRPLKVHVKRF
jgi:hypothetical protein